MTIYTKNETFCKILNEDVRSGEYPQTKEPLLTDFVYNL